MKRIINIKKIFLSLPFIVGVFIIIYAGISIVYFQKQAQYKNLKVQIDDTYLVLQTKPNPDLEVLNDNLSNIEAEIAEKIALLPTSAQGIEVIDTLIAETVMSNVEFSRLEGAPLIEDGGEEIGAGTSPILPLIFYVEGTKYNTLVFISNMIENYELLKSLEIKGISIQQSASSSDEYVTKMELNVYVQSGAS
jgi:hypothetical protein